MAIIFQIEVVGSISGGPYWYEWVTEDLKGTQMRIQEEATSQEYEEAEGTGSEEGIKAGC